MRLVFVHHFVLRTFLTVGPRERNRGRAVVGELRPTGNGCHDSKCINRSRRPWTALACWGARNNSTASNRRLNLEIFSTCCRRLARQNLQPLAASSGTLLLITSCFIGTCRRVTDS